MKRLLFVGGLIALSGCTSASSATRALQDAGYRDIQMTGYRWFLCDEKDTFSTGFSAIGPSGRRVTGAVCAGFLKGNTIRFD